jgi:SulP family sulfate permease
MTNTATPAAQKRPIGPDIPYLLSEWKDIFNKATIQSDLWAGLTVAFVALPLNLALAIAAGVEPGVGITTGIVGAIIAALIGGQRCGITGPAAAMAVVLIGVAEQYGLRGIWMVGLIAGVLQLLAGWFRLGRLIAFIPTPVIVGFSNAIGCLIIFNALHDFLGISKAVAHVGDAAKMPGHQFMPEFIQDIWMLAHRAVTHGEVNVSAVVTGALVVGLTLLLPRLTKAIPSSLIAIVVASTLAIVLGFNVPKIIDIAHVPASLPMPQIPSLPWDDLEALFPTAITVFMLGSIESLLSASVADGMLMTKRHHSNQELIGQGVANLVVPLFGGIPVTGVIARTAVNIRAGAKTRLAAMVHSCALFLLVIAFAKYAEQIPLAALAGVLVVTGFRLIEWDLSQKIFKASLAEGCVLVTTTLVSVLVDLTAGVFVGLIMTCALFIKSMSGTLFLPESDPTDRRARMRQPVPTCKFVRTFLVDGPLFFGAVERFAETIVHTQNLKAVVLHMKALTIMDMTGAETLLSTHARLSRAGVRMVLCELPQQPFELLKRIGAVETIGAENFFDDYTECLLDVNARVMESEKGCHDCKGLLTCAPGTKITAPSDCPMRTGIVLNQNHVKTLLSERLGAVAAIAGGTASALPAASPVPSRNGSGTVRGGEQVLAGGVDGSRLRAVTSEEDIPEFLRPTPISGVLKSQNLLTVDSVPNDSVNLILGMCMDYRKQIQLPGNCAYIIRSPGANMKESELGIALAVAAGIRHMALITHNNCLMTDPFANRDAVIRSLVDECGWNHDDATNLFDRKAHADSIGDPIAFAIAESARLEALFRGLTVVPLLYSVDDDRLYLIENWVAQRRAAQPALTS